MFRAGIKKSEIREGNFGVGSIIKGSPQIEETWLVVQFQDSSVMLCNLVTFETTNSIKVDDPAFLTVDEARKLVDTLKLPYAFIDFSCMPKGLKGSKEVKDFKY